LCPLRTLAQPLEHLSKVFVATRQIGITRMLVETSGRLVEGYLRQRALFDVGKERRDVLQVARAVGGARREARIVVEWLVVRLEDRAARVAVVDDVALRFRILPAVGERFVPAARVPRPAHTLGGERITDRLLLERRQRVECRIGEVEARAG